MAERSRRIRRQISDVTEDSPDVSDAESEDFDLRKQDAARRAGKQEPLASPSSRSKRVVATVISPQSPNYGDGKQSIKLTMKVAPSKLREVMRANEVDALKDTLGGGQVLDGPRSRRSATQSRSITSRAANRPTYIEPQESDPENEEVEDEDDDPEAEAEDDTMMNDFDEIGAEPEGGTDDEDVEMEDEPSPPKKNIYPPKSPKITLKTPVRKDNKKPLKPTLIVTPADVGPVLSVEDEEMEDDPDDEEVDDSELLDNDDETNLIDEDAEVEEELNEDGGEGEGEGEDEDEDEDEEAEEGDGDDDDDDLGDSDEELASGAATPDPTKMTSRQRGRPIEPLMALDMAPQQRKFFTDEEKAMKKDEHARKRKELTKRKTQEEKTAALNRLLKPQVSKTRGAAPKAETLAAQMQAAAEEEEVVEKADPMFTRWVSTKEGIKLGVPEEWLGKKVGRCFGASVPPRNGRLVQEVE